jgi:predicted ATP-binding protein involved in virulence
MRIQSIAVTNLFGTFDHAVALNQAERITIVYGPNGFGKTYLLSAVCSLFNGRFAELADMPFSVLQVGLDDGSIARAVRNGAVLTGMPALEIVDASGVREPVDAADFTARTAAVRVKTIRNNRLVEFSDTCPDRPAISLCAERMRVLLADHSGGELNSRIGLLARIVNSRFIRKRIAFDAESGFSFITGTGAVLSPEKLSAGEQHAVIMLFDLLFDTGPDTLVLIDEPEISLHVYWQQQLIPDIRDIIAVGQFDVLIATHSPQIIHDRWDLTVELREPGE